MHSDSPASATTRRSDWLLAATVLTSAWLLFQVQPMAGKRILPWFGGGPAVWTTAMLFFQAALLAGYLYAHFSAKWLRPRTQAVVHALLLGAALVMLMTNGVIAADSWKPVGSSRPTLRILATLAATVGLPYLMLSATAPLVQSWWARRHGAGSPYRLYALSNVGSLAALVSYPLIFEPLFGLGFQGVGWSVAFGVFAALCAASGWSASASQRPLPPGEGRGEGESLTAPSHPALSQGERVLGHSGSTKLDVFHWLALPACASAMLLAATNYLCQDVASLPLLWVAPLAVYLVTFIIAFDADRWYVRWFWMAALAAASFGAIWSWSEGAVLAIRWQVAVHLALVLTVGMVCHGEVARLRPAPSRLTAFYLCLSVGGVLGGLFVAVVAPLVFSNYDELPLSMFAAWVLAMTVLASDPHSALYRGRWIGVWILIVALWGVLVYLAVVQFRTFTTDVIGTNRNFFGILKVQEVDNHGSKLRWLYNGRIRHGAQFVDMARSREATTYYSPASGVGKLLAGPVATPRRVGMVGLGAGTVAAYAEAGDHFRFYDINPQVVAFADKYFTYLEDARRRDAEIVVVDGDARLALEREAPQEFDVLALDAFSGDSIPMHLLTLEAFELYLRHLRDPGGALAVHISNRHLDLAPVVQAAADRYDLETTVVASGTDAAHGTHDARWLLLRRRGAGGSPLPGKPLALAPPSTPIVWTDDHSSLWSVLKRRE
jgi:hypothetical protein